MTAGSTSARSVLGMYQPDGIASYRAGGKTYLVTGNEGDAREVVSEGDVVSFAEEARVRSLVLDGAAFPTAATLRDNAKLGRLNVTNQLGGTDGDGDFDPLYAFGARPFSIWAGAQLESSYANDRDFAVDVCERDADDECVGPNPAAGDLGPEGLEFVPAAESPTGEPLLIVGSEISGTTTLWQVND